MDIEYTIEYALINLFYIYTIKRFLLLFFSKCKVKLLICFLAYIFLYVINTLGNLFINNPICNMATSIIGLLVITCCYEGNVLKRISAILMIYILCMSVDITTAILIDDYLIGKRVCISANVLSYLSIFIIELLIEKIYEFKYKKSLWYNRFKITLSVPMISMAIIILIVINQLSEKYVAIIICIGILFINLLVFYLQDLLVQSYEAKYYSLVLQQEVEEYKHQLKVIQESEDKIFKLKHDMKHHIRAIGDLIKSNENERAINYLKHIEKITNSSHNYISSGNKDIDSILNYMIEKAKDQNITIKPSINIPSELDLDFFDINIILANLLENAIEAASDSKEKLIKVRIEFDRHILYIGVINSFNGKLIFGRNGQLNTTKTNI